VVTEYDRRVGFVIEHSLGPKFFDPRIGARRQKRMGESKESASRETPVLTRSGRALCAGLVTLLATTVLAQPLSRLLVGPFSYLQPGGMPVGWEPMRFPSVDTETDYALVSQAGRVVLRASSRMSASAALRRVPVDVERRPVIEWSWTTDAACYVGNWQDPETDDFPLRLFVIFEPMSGIFSLLQRFEPGFRGDAVVYVPQSQPPQGSDPTSHVNARIKFLPVLPGAPGGASAREQDGWDRHRRDVRADYIRLFGRAPKRVAGVAVMTDTDNTETACVSHFGDISFSESAS
jgi:hypothetical protein